MQSAWANPILLLVLTTLIWAAHSIVGRLAVGQIGPMTLTCLRWAVALIPIFITARPSLRQDWPALRARWVYLAIMGASGFTAFNALFYVAAHHTSALNLSIIQGAVPALVLLGARVFLGVRFSALQALGAVVTMLGVGVIAAQGDLAKLAALAFNSGDVMMVVGVVLYAGYTIGLRQRPHVSQGSMLAAMALAAFVTSVPLMIWELMSGGFERFLGSIEGRGWIAIAERDQGANPCLAAIRWLPTATMTECRTRKIPDGTVVTLHSLAVLPVEVPVLRLQFARPREHPTKPLSRCITP